MSFARYVEPISALLQDIAEWDDIMAAWAAYVDPWSCAAATSYLDGTSRRHLHLGLLGSVGAGFRRYFS